jgi:hypothetical protein
LIEFRFQILFHIPIILFEKLTLRTTFAGVTENRLNYLIAIICYQNAR